MSLRPQPRPGVMQIDAYVPGKSTAPKGVRLHKLSSNETPLGPSPRAIEAVRAGADGLAIYPEGTAGALREAIGAKYGLDPARIVCGAGSDDLLTLLAHAFIGPGDEGLFTTHGFLLYRIAILAAGGVPVVAPATPETAPMPTGMIPPSGDVTVSPSRAAGQPGRRWWRAPRRPGWPGSRAAP